MKIEKLHEFYLGHFANLLSITEFQWLHLLILISVSHKSLSTNLLTLILSFLSMHKIKSFFAFSLSHFSSVTELQFLFFTSAQIEIKSMSWQFMTFKKILNFSLIVMIISQNPMGIWLSLMTNRFSLGKSLLKP